MMASNARAVHDAAIERERAVRREPAARNDLPIAGVAGGLLAGAAMVAWAAASGAVAGLPPSRPLELAAATFAGREALAGGPGVLVSGALLWAAVSAALGLLFATLVPRDFPFMSAAILGVGYSLVVLALAASVVLPRVDPVMREEMPAAGGSWVLAYVAFGIVLGLVPPLRRRLAAR
jgi:hypothetical protein